MMCGTGSAYKRLSSYALNGSIARLGGDIETHLMDLPLDICEVEQHYTLNDSIVMFMLVHVEMNLMELPT